MSITYLLLISEDMSLDEIKRITLMETSQTFSNTSSDEVDNFLDSGSYYGLVRSAELLTSGSEEPEAFGEYLGTEFKTCISLSLSGDLRDLVRMFSNWLRETDSDLALVVNFDRIMLARVDGTVLVNNGKYYRWNPLVLDELPKPYTIKDILVE